MIGWYVLFVVTVFVAFGMEFNGHRKCCPMFCILKTVLFAVIVVFMLFVPLGDPLVACQSVGRTQNTRVAMCYLCEGYFLAAKAADKAVQVLDYLLCVIMDLLYEAKLKFYALLKRMDQQDLCGSVCCAVDDDASSEENREIQCPQCKSIIKKCSRRPRTVCRYAQL